MKNIKPWEMTEKEFLNFVIGNPGYPEKDQLYNKWLLEMDDKSLKEIDNIQRMIIDKEIGKNFYKMENAKTKQEYKKYLKKYFSCRDSLWSPQNEYKAIIIWAKEKGYIKPT